MTTLFRGATNGGANRVFLRDGDLKIAGQAVGGRPSLDADLIAKVWGAKSVQTADLKAGASLEDLNDAKISVVQTGGEGFVLNALAEIGVTKFNFNPSQNETPGVGVDLVDGRFNDMERALNGARVLQDVDGGWELRFSGGGMGGAFNTNADFATQDDAEAFLQSLKDGLAKGDTWGVVVEDDDLDGDFVFEFSGWYRDVNANKIEGKLAGSGVHSDGDIGSKAEGAAANLALFLDQMANGGDSFVLKALEKVGTGLGNVGQVEKGAAGPASADAIGAQFVGGVENALDRAKLRQEADGEWELFFSGNGVGGQVTTNGDFKSEEAAQEFLDSLIAAQPGFLDDALF